MAGATYSVGLDFGNDLNPSHVNTDPYWIIAIISQGTLLTYSRKSGSSIFKNLANDPILNTTPPLIITSDCVSLNISGSKRDSSDSLQATLKQTTVNYLSSIYPGDYILAWIVNNRDKETDLLNRIQNLEPCNRADDGLKFVGRVEDCRKQLNQDPNVGFRTLFYNLTATSFSELQTFFFYDYSLASNDAQAQDLGTWLARLGQDYQSLFGSSSATAVKEDNINQIIPTLLNLIVGSGPSKAGNINIQGFGGESVTATPTLANEAPYAYVIPLSVGKLLGKIVTEPGKPSNILGFCDILELIIGIQTYSNKTGIKIFVPDIDPKSTARNKITTKPMQGTFLPYVTEFTNVPVWNLLQRYINPAINEIYTALKVNGEGNVVPTITCRQIPFTTEAFQDTPPVQLEGPTLPGQQNVYQQAPLNVTKFLDLPKWLIPASMITGFDIGRSNATRTNFVHIYGSAALMQNNVGINEQIVVNPPIRDDLDIQRSGLRPYMKTVDCFVSDQVGRTPNAWMRLVADWTIGSHLTLSGSIHTFGIQSPIAKGDNIQLMDVVYHIESMSHKCNITTDGKKTWRTSLNLSNGMRVNGTVDTIDKTNNQMPIYAGLLPSDQKQFDPGIITEGPQTINASLQALQTPNQQIFEPDPFKNSQIIDNELAGLL